MARKLSKFFIHTVSFWFFLAIPVLGLAAFFFSPESPIYLVSMEKYQQVWTFSWYPWKNTMIFVLISLEKYQQVWSLSWFLWKNTNRYDLCPQIHGKISTGMIFVPISMENSSRYDLCPVIQGKIAADMIFIRIWKIPTGMNFVLISMEIPRSMILSSYP